MRRLTTLVLVALLALTVWGAGGVAHARVEPLPSGVDADYQLGGVDAVPDHVGIVVRDRRARPATGAYTICYVNGFQTQPDERAFWRQHGRWSLILQHRGRAVVDGDWGEWLLDIGSAAKRRWLADIVGRWIAGCADRGFRAVEFDNLDSFTRSRHRLDRADALAFARLLVRRAHAAGLAAGQKNLAGYDGTRIGFDFAVAESCAQYDECGRYVRAFGDQVVMVEYRRPDFAEACRDYGADHPVVLRDLALRPSYTPDFC